MSVDYMVIPNWNRTPTSWLRLGFILLHQHNNSENSEFEVNLTGRSSHIFFDGSLRVFAIQLLWISDFLRKKSF